MDLLRSYYILQCADGTFYTGIAIEPHERERRHNAGKAADWTRRRRPVRLVFVEHHATKSAARRRELEIKGWRREKKTALIESGNSISGRS